MHRLIVAEGKEVSLQWSASNHTGALFLPSIFESFYEGHEMRFASDCSEIANAVNQETSQISLTCPSVRGQFPKETLR